MDVHFGAGELAVISTMLLAVTGALTAIFKLLMAAKDTALADAKATAENYKSVANDAVRIMQAALVKQKEAEGKIGVKQLAPVLPEHQSPVTEAELATANQATLRAAVTAAALELGLPPRSTPPDVLPEDTRPDSEKVRDLTPESEQRLTALDMEGLVSKTEVVQAVLAVPSPTVPPVTFSNLKGSDLMTPNELKKLAEKFRGVADDSKAVVKLADDTATAHPTDTALQDLCTRFRGAKDADAVRAICDEVKTR